MQPDRAGGRGGARHGRERSIGRGDEPPRERDPLRLVRVEDPIVGAPPEDRRQFPREVHRVADASVHPLTTHRAVNVCRVAQEERASTPEAIGDAMVNLVRRKPIDALDVDSHPFDDARAHIVPGQGVTGTD